MAPEKIENIYLRSTFVAQAFVHGDSLRVSLHAADKSMLFVIDNVKSV